VSSLVFDPETGLAAPDTAAIRERVAGMFKAAFGGSGGPELDTEPASPAGQLVDALVAEIEAKNEETLFLANQFNPMVSEGRWQEALGRIYFLRRKRAEPTVVSCRVGGRAGTAIPYGALVEDADGLRLMCSRAIQLGSDGLGDTTFRCLKVGEIPVAPHTVNRIVTAVAGWDSVDNPEAGAMGRELESRADFESRRAESVAMNAHGSVPSLYGALHNLSGVAGVIDVQVLENIGPDPITRYGVAVPGHGVTICIFGGRDEDVARVIYEKKDAGCDTGGNTVVTHVAGDMGGAVYEFRIVRPQAVNLWAKVELGVGEQLDEALTARVKAAVLADFGGANASSGNPRVGLASTVYASRFYSAVTAAGVRNLYGISIRLGDSGAYGAAIQIRGDQEPVMSGANIIVEVRT
jgi:uncharacterized phage protein gp47/JayE